MSAIVLGGCKVKRPGDVIAEDKMEKIIYDYHIAKALGDNLPYDENYKRQLYIDAVFRKHGIDEATFDSSLVWYSRNTTELSDIYERVAERLRNEQKNIDAVLAGRDRGDVTSANGDSVDVWAWRRLIELGTMPMNNRFSFELRADSNYKVNDLFVLSSDFMIAGGRLGASEPPVMALQLVYENDSVVGITKRVMTSGKTMITVGDDKIGKIKSLNGFFYRPQSDSNRSKVIVSNIALMRYHSNDTIIADVDSVAVDSLSADTTLKNKLPEINVDTLKPERLSPETMNKRRTNMKRVERPEQIEVEKKIKAEQKMYEKRDSRNRNRLKPVKK
jgi:hypothetical protein